MYVAFLVVSVLLACIRCAPVADVSNDYDVRVYAPANDVTLLVGETQQITFFAKRTNATSKPDNFTIEFTVADIDVASVRPPTVLVTFPSDALLVNFTVNVRAEFAGQTTVNGTATEKAVSYERAFLRVTVSHLQALNILSDIVGWVYFVAWSVSFYPQIYENWKRKSVIGLNFDFVGLNIVGFTLYGLFNIGLFWIKTIQDEYFLRHPVGVNPVQLNDVIFALHASFACAVTIFQCVIYERGQQSISKPCKFLFGVFVLIVAISLILAASSVLYWLDFLYICSYIKLFITLVKYVPQAYMNYRRKSTMGWSIGNVLLDFTGGILSIAQMFIQSFNHNDWTSIFGDPTKFGLGLFSVVFDVFFIVQHYVFYRNNQPSEPLINEPEYEDDRPNSDSELSN